MAKEQALEDRRLVAIRAGTFEEGVFPEGRSASVIDSNSEEAQESEDAPIQTTRLEREIPEDMWRESEADLRQFCQDELTNARTERSDFERKIARWKLAYRAPMAEEPKHFPIWNASNMTLPIIKETVHTIAAQIAQSTIVVRPRWVLTNLAEEWRPFTDRIERFLDIASDRDMDLGNRAIPYIIEGTKLGTAVFEVPWAYRKKNVYKYTPDGKKVYKSTQVHRDGPLPEHFPLQDFFIRFDQTDVNETRWCARRIWKTEYDLRTDLQNGLLYGLENISGDTRIVRDIATRVDEDIERTRPNRQNLWEVFKISIAWDIDGDGEDEELQLYYSLDARDFLARRFTPFWHGKRPYVVWRYFQVDHRFYGMGLCEMLEVLQTSMSEDFNKRADNQTLANASMIIKRKLTKGLMPGDPLYAAKIIETADIWNDIREFRISEPYPSTMQEIGFQRKLSDDLSGVSDAQRGSALPVTRTTAAAQLSLLQEQATRISLTVGDVRRALDEVGALATSLYYQFGTGGRALEWMGEDGRPVEALFRLPRRVAEIGHALKAQTPTSAVNRQVKRENSIALFNLMMQLYERILPMAGQLAPESAPEIVHALVKSAKRFMEDVLGTFDVTDPEDVLAGLVTLERLLPNPADLGGEQFRRTVENEELIQRIRTIEDLYEEAKQVREDERDPSRRRTRSPTNGRVGSNGGTTGPIIPLGDGGQVPPFIGPTAAPPVGPGRGV